MTAENQTKIPCHPFELHSLYLVLELIPSDGPRLQLPFTDRELYNQIKDAILDIHGDYGLATVQMSLSVRYLNPYTHIALVRVKRGCHQMVGTAITFIKKVCHIEVTFRTLHVGGTIRTCQKFISTYHYRQLPKLLKLCTSQKEKEAVHKALAKTESAVMDQSGRQSATAAEAELCMELMEND